MAVSTCMCCAATTGRETVTKPMANADAAGHMDQIYRYQRFIYDLTRKPYLLGRDRLIAELDPPPGGAVLEIACGTGRNLVHAAQRYPAATFYGLDVSAAMLATPPRSIAEPGLAQRIPIPHPA